MATGSEGSEDSISLTSTPEPVWDADAEFQVEEILAEKVHDGEKVFLVKWEQYDHLDNTWEPIESFVKDEPLVQWDIRKKLEDLGEEEPFDVSRWERRKSRAEANKLKRSQRRAKKRERLRQKANISTTGRTVATRSKLVKSRGQARLEFSSESETSSEGGNKQHSTLRTSRSLQKDDESSEPESGPGSDKKSSATMLSKQQAGSFTRQAQDKENASSLGTPKSRERPQKDAMEHPAADVIKPQRKSKSLKTIEGSRRRLKGSEDQTKPAARASSPKLVHKETETQVQPRSSLIVKPNIFANFHGRAEQKQPTASAPSASGNTQQEGKQYSSFRQQRRAELRGRAEPPPNLDDVLFPGEEPHQSDRHPVVPSNEARRVFSAGTQIANPQPIRSENVSQTHHPGQVRTNKDRLTGPDARSTNPAESAAPQFQARRVSFLETASGEPSQLIDRSVDDNTQPCQNRSTDLRITASTDSGRSFVDANRGISSIEHFREAVSFPISALQQDLFGKSAKENPPISVYGHFKLDDQLIPIELTCTSLPFKYLLLKVKRGQEVHFHLTYLIMAEEFRDLIHENGNVYFGAGQAHPRFDRFTREPMELAANKIQSLAEALRRRNSGALFFDDRFCMLVWPSETESWKEFDKLFSSDAPSSSLRYIVRTAIKKPSTEADATVNVSHDLKTNSGKDLNGYFPLMNALLGFDFRRLFMKASSQSLFLLYPAEKRYEHDFLFTLAHRNGVRVWSSLSPGHWDDFCTEVAGRSGHRDKLHHVRSDVVLVHTSFQQLRHMPRLFRLLDRDVRIYTVDAAQKHQEATIEQGQPFDELDLIRDARMESRCTILGAEAMIDQGKILWRFVLPPKKVLAELFPYHQGQAILLLDSFLVNEPESAYRLLRWYKSHAADKIGTWRFVVRPHVHSWIRLILSDLKARDPNGTETSQWEKVRHIVDDLVGPDRMDKAYDHNIADPNNLPRILSFPAITCSGLDIEYPVGSRRGSLRIRRSNDEALFKWFAHWSLGETRIFRRFHVISGEHDKEILTTMHSSWTRDWRHISFGPGSEFMDGHKVNEWYRQVKEKKRRAQHTEFPPPGEPKSA